MKTLPPELPYGDGKEGKRPSSSQTGLFLRHGVQGGCKKQKHGTVSQLLGSSDIETSCASDFRKAVLFNSRKLIHPL